MIKIFKCKHTQKLFQRNFVQRFPHDIQRTALRKLVMIEVSESLSDLRIPPSNQLEKLKGDREGQYSIRINDQWRICFEWHEGNAYDVEIVDYH